MRPWLTLAAGMAVALGLTGAGRAADEGAQEQTAGASSEADAIIAHSAVGDLFQNVSAGAEPKVRHNASGLVCWFGSDQSDWARDNITVFPSGLPRGDDVGCNIWRKTFLISMDITRFAPVPSLAEATAAYAGSVMKLHPKARPYTGPTHDMQRPAGLQPWTTVRYVFDDRGGQFSRLSVAVVNGWVIEERATGPLSEADFGDTVSEAEMAAAVASVTGAP